MYHFLEFSVLGPQEFGLIRTAETGNKKLRDNVNNVVSSLQGSLESETSLGTLAAQRLGKTEKIIGDPSLQMPQLCGVDL